MQGSCASEDSHSCPQELQPCQLRRGRATTCPHLLPTSWSGRSRSAAMAGGQILPVPKLPQEHREAPITAAVWAAVPVPQSRRPGSAAVVWVAAVAQRAPLQTQKGQGPALPHPTPDLWSMQPQLCLPAAAGMMVAVTAIRGIKRKRSNGIWSLNGLGKTDNEETQK